MEVEQASRKFLAMETASRSEQIERGEVPTFGDFCAGSVRARLDRFKPSTQRSAGWVLRGHLLLAFGSLPLDRITPAGAHRWFDECGGTASGGASCVLSVFHRILEVVPENRTGR